MLAIEHFHNMDNRVTIKDCITASEMLHQSSITQVPNYEVDKQNYQNFAL